MTTNKIFQLQVAKQNVQRRL